MTSSTDSPHPERSPYPEHVGMPDPDAAAGPESSANRWRLAGSRSARPDPDGLEPDGTRPGDEDTSAEGHPPRNGMPFGQEPSHPLSPAAAPAGRDPSPPEGPHPPWSDPSTPAQWPAAGQFSASAAAGQFSASAPAGQFSGASVTPVAPQSVFRRHAPLFVALGVSVLALVCLAGAVLAITVGRHMFTKDTTRATVAMGQPVRDGKFMFTASKIKCGVQEVGTPDDYQTPTGQFCIVNLKITNVGKSPAIYADSIQRAIGPNGSWYIADTPAGYYANPDPLIFLNEINPGNHIDVAIVYDIPPTASIAKLELHENPYTKGAIVRVR